MPPRADVAPGTNELLKTGNSPQAKVEEVIERASDDPAKVVAELKKQQKSKDANPNASTSSLRTMFEDFSSEAGR
jgi:hypothetical protein